MTDATIIDELIQYERMEKAAFAVPIEKREAEALRLKNSGVKPWASTDIDGNLTMGYGLLDQFGFWQFPLPPIT